MITGRVLRVIDVVRFWDLGFSLLGCGGDGGDHGNRNMVINR